MVDRRAASALTVLAIAALTVAGCGSSASKVSDKIRTADSTVPASTTTSTIPATTVPPTTAPPTTVATTTTTTRATAPAAAAGASCSANLAQGLASTGGARQLVTVESQGYATDVATVTLWQKAGQCWQVAYGPWSGYIGYNGFSDHKQEGDGRTPTGIYGFGPVVYGNAANPGVNEAYHQLVCGDWWDEDPQSSLYNTFEHVPCGTTPSWSKGSEALWTETAPYPSFAVVDYNTSPVVPGAGSGIFVHASTGGGTAGCVSVPLGELDEFLRWMQPSASPRIVMAPASEISRF